ncbi:hypothetical protein NLJ89_g6822 [Agrocybe chaxingu]|uniref:RlpA-like protein double-psi beta-barrel domain-containing protein n=1 Tax=Agrocybe chaxingu TaxID=84603 RepID=A0A9W8JXJ2_9AGAR|nr:hypothetical protein NLJ89_g6822 [Agrocybe chaxingu]
MMLFSGIFRMAVALISMAATVQAYWGRATWYYDGVGACGGWNMNADYVVALAPSEYYNNGGHCNKMIRDTRRIDQGRSITAKVVDLCPSCGSGAIDLSLAAFQALAPLEMGVINVEWDFIWS